jgi:DNA-binding transcriptional LysR family regulator
MHPYGITLIVSNIWMLQNPYVINMRMIELRHLRYFIAVAEERHVTRAAQRLGIQQPPLSQQIRALEQAVGTPLLQRLPRGVELTEAGQVFLDEARLALDQVAHAVEAARRSARGEEGRLAIGYTSSAAFHALIPAVVRSFRQASPDVALVLEEGWTSDLVPALQRQQLDAAFIRVPVGEASELTIEHLADERMLAALPAQHPLAAQPGSVALADLAEEIFVLYRRPTGPGLYDAIIAACRTAGFSPRVGQEAPRLVSTLSLVAAGLGVSIIPDSMRRLDTEGIVYRSLSDAPDLVAPLYLAYRTAGQSGATRRLIAQVRQMVRG